jgi:hypothetical protein
MKKYNPSLFGYATGTSSPNVWEIARLNVAMPGAGSESLAGQARDVVQRLQTHPEVSLLISRACPENQAVTNPYIYVYEKVRLWFVFQVIDFQNDWKMVNIFSGGNDVCGYCRHQVL